MKRFYISMFLFILMAMPVVSNASNETDTQELIRSLIQQVERLQKTVDALLKEDGQTTKKPRTERRLRQRNIGEKKADEDRPIPPRPVVPNRPGHGWPAVQA